MSTSQGMEGKTKKKNKITTWRSQGSDAHKLTLNAIANLFTK